MRRDNEEGSHAPQINERKQPTGLGLGVDAMLSMNSAPVLSCEKKTRRGAIDDQWTEGRLAMCWIVEEQVKIGSTFNKSWQFRCAVDSKTIPSTTVCATAYAVISQAPTTE